MKILGREVIVNHKSELVSRHDNMSCGLSNPREIYWTEYRLKTGTKVFYDIADIKKHIKSLNKRKDK